MNRLTYFLISAFLISLFIAGSLLYGASLVIGSEDTLSEDIPFHYMWTTAVCDGNACRDYQVTCLDGEAIRMDPISGMVIFPHDWKDKRTNHELCPR